MVVTLAKLEEFQACSNGILWFENQKETELLKVCLALIADSHAFWANWLIVRYMTKRQRVMYAIFAAEHVLHIFEQRYPDDNRPREAIRATRAWLDNSDKTIDAAYAAYAAIAAAAAAAAVDAAYAAYAAIAAAAAAATVDAAYAAYAAAYAASAASAAASTADVATTAYAAYAPIAAAASAFNAAYATARRELQIKIINYGIEILGEL